MACLWVESQSRKLKRHIHHAMCGHGGERCIKIGKQEIQVDGFDLQTNTVYQYHGCYWHGCNCDPDFFDQKKYNKTLDTTQKIRDAGFNVVAVWEHEAQIDVIRARPQKTKRSTGDKGTRDPDGRTIVLREIVDIAKLGYILKYADHFDRYTDGKDRKGEVTILKGYYERLFKGDNTTRYHQTKQTG